MPRMRTPSTLGADPAQCALSPLNGPLRGLEPLRWRLVHRLPGAAPWNEFRARYHPLGCHLRYFIEDRPSYLLNGFAARFLAVRDHWIGWQDQFDRPLQRVVRQARFLLFCGSMSVGACAMSGLECAGPELAPAGRGLVVRARCPARAGGNVSQPYTGTCYRASPKCAVPRAPCQRRRSW